MNYNRAIFFKDGNVITITDKEAYAVKTRLLAGDRFVEVQGNLISADNVARVGDHVMSAENKRIENASIETSMLIAGKDEQVKKLRDLRKKLSMKSIQMEKEELLELPVAKEEDDGAPMYYLSEYGEKLYS